MCYQPLRLVNPTRNYRTGYDKIHVSVPCGRCAECEASKQDDWFIRSYSAWFENRLKGGNTLFVTLTFDNDNLPWFTDFGVPIKKPCFDYDKVRSFIKKLGVYYSRLVGSSAGLKYIIFSEYGSHTQRPHHHGLIMFPPSARQLGVRTLKHIIEKAWIYGFVRWSKESKGGALVNNVISLQYSSKYASKDMNFYGIPELIEFEKRYKLSRDDEDHELYKNYKRHCPRHWQSQSFGFNWLSRQLCSRIDDDYNFILREDAAFRLENGIRPYLLQKSYYFPRYIIDKLSYKYTKDGVRYMTECGMKLQEKILYNQINRKIKQYKDILSEKALHDKFTEQDVFELTRFKTFDEFLGWLDSFFGKHTLYDLAIYDTFYKDRSATHLLQFYDFEFLKRTPCSFFNYWAAHMFEVYSHKSTDRLSPSIPEYRDLSFDQLFTKYGENLSFGCLTSDRVKEEGFFKFNDFPCYSKFDYILDVFRQLSTIHRKRAFVANAKLKNEISNLRDLLNQNI